MVQGGTDDKLIIEDRLEEVAGVKPERFLPPVADVVVPEVLCEQNGEERHQAGNHPT